MNIDNFENIAEKFLINDKPEVLVIKGSWGIGKTFAWKRLVNRNKERIIPKTYCYVSLFGIASIKELRMAILVNSIQTELLGKTFDYKSDKSDLSKFALSKIRFASLGCLKSLIEKIKIPYIDMKNISISLENLASHLIRDTLICFDDFERLKDSINTEELLGLVSELKEEKNCKIILIFNEEKLKDSAVYETYREKVVDIGNPPEK